MITLSRDLENLTELIYFIETTYSNFEYCLHLQFILKMQTILKIFTVESKTFSILMCFFSTLKGIFCSLEFSCLGADNELEFDFLTLGISSKAMFGGQGRQECFCSMRHLRELLPFTCSKSIITLMVLQI